MYMPRLDIWYLALFKLGIPYETVTDMQSVLTFNLQ
jgi:hypothetical protein